MGADGHIICVKRADWDRCVPVGVTPWDLGLYTGEILGVPAVWGYHGDNIDGRNYGNEWDLCYDERADTKADAATVTKRKKALEWFNTSAEWHEVWT